ncbi:unnamed protein product [Prunus armeniaca]
MDQVKVVSTFLAIELLHVAPRMLGSKELATPTPDLTKAPAGGAASYSLGEEEAQPKLA